MPQPMPDFIDQFVISPLPVRTIVYRIYWDEFGPLAPHPHADGRMAPALLCGGWWVGLFARWLRQ